MTLMNLLVRIGKDKPIKLSRSTAKIVKQACEQGLISFRPITELCDKSELCIRRPNHPGSCGLEVEKDCDYRLTRKGHEAIVEWCQKTGRELVKVLT